MPGAEPLPPPDVPGAEPAKPAAPEVQPEKEPVTGTEGQWNAAPEAAPEPQESEGPGLEADPADTGAIDADLAPTLPKSRAAEFAAVDEPLPPTLPPGVITSIDVEEASLAADADLAADTASPPAVEAVPDTAAETLLAATAEEVPEEAPPLSSATLAELYFEQGLLERAVEVYRQVLDEEPGNEGARARLVELEKLVAAGAAELPVPAGDGANDAEVRRRALERTIERLEALLTLVRRS